MLKVKIITTNNQKYFINITQGQSENQKEAIAKFIHQIKTSEFIKVNDFVYILSNHIVSVEAVL